MIRVVIADDHVLVRMGIGTILGEQRDITVCGSAGTGEDAVALARTLAPDVVLLDLSMPGCGGLAAAAEIVAANAGVHVLVHSCHGAPALIRAALAVGATGYLFKGADAGQLVDAVRAVHRGDVWLCPAAATALADDLLIEDSRPPRNRGGRPRHRRGPWVRRPTR